MEKDFIEEILENLKNEWVNTKLGLVRISCIIASINRVSWRAVKYPWKSWPMNQVIFDIMNDLEISKEDQKKIWKTGSKTDCRVESFVGRWLSANYKKDCKWKKYSSRKIANIVKYQQTEKEGPDNVQIVSPDK